MSWRVALAGNPNSGKTTLFNRLTGLTRSVGNWPGVTVEKAEGSYRRDKNLKIVDLPGIYSLSPYTQEEVVARDYLTGKRPDVIINIVDASNLERNLYLTTQLLELGLPMVIALNMMDVVERRGDRIDREKLSNTLGCPVVEISALKGRGLETLMQNAVQTAERGFAPHPIAFGKEVESWLERMMAFVPPSVPKEQRRFFAIKLFEKDSHAPSTAESLALADLAAQTLDDDGESMITDERYQFISQVVATARAKKATGLTLSDRIDRLATNRLLGLPIFALIMYGVYTVSVTTVGTWVTDFTNDTFVAEWIQEPARALLENHEVAGWLTGLICDGLIAGVGAVLGFLPQLLILFFFLALLEDCGYMARIAFLMDRVFRRFGMSGKSFIPMLIGTGCSIPGIMSTRSIENINDRRITAMTVSFMPCGAKLPVIAMISGALFDNSGTVAFSAYALGILSVIVTGILLKKTKALAGDPAPFVIELPAYHLPSPRNVWHSMWDRAKGFAKKAVTIYTLAAVLVWFTSSFGWIDGAFGMVEDLTDSVGHAVGNALAWFFRPTGFDTWQAVIASILGLTAKEEVVGVIGVLSALGDGDAAMQLVEEGGNLAPLAAMFGGSALSGYCFLVFNLLCVPCIAAVNTMRAELQNWRWTLFAILYQCGFAYLVALMIYQFGTWYFTGAFTAWTAASLAAALALLWGLVRPGYKAGKEKEKNA